jgi:hypothetical protein
MHYLRTSGKPAIYCTFEVATQEGMNMSVIFVGHKDVVVSNYGLLS